MYRQGLIGALGATLVLGAVSALPVDAARPRRLNMSGNYEGTITLNGSGSEMTVSIGRQNRKTGKFSGFSGFFESTVEIKGRVKSRRAIVWTSQSAVEKVTFNGEITGDGAVISGTWKSRMHGHVMSSGTFSLAETQAR